MTKDDIQLLYEYDRWVNNRVLQTVSTLSAEEFTRDLGGSFRSVRDTLVHIIRPRFGNAQCGTVGDAHLQLFRLYQIFFEETSVHRPAGWNYAATFQRVTWDRGPQLPCCVIRRRSAIVHSTRVRMSISETSVRWTGHFSAISSSFERCSWVSRPANSRSLSMRSSIPSLVSQSAQSAA
jgi:hypothetical protein